MFRVTFKPVLLMSTAFFIASAAILLESQNYWMATVHMLIALFNAILPYRIKKFPDVTIIFLVILNALISFIMVWFYSDHSNPIFKLIGAFAGFIFLLLAIVYLNKALKKYI